MPIDHHKNIIEVNHVNFRYANEMVLKDVTLAVHQGDYLGLVGPNGGGKTTLLKIMLGLLQPNDGEVRLFGTPIQKFKHWGDIGYVPQKAVNFDSNFPATVWEVVAMGRYGRKKILQSLTADDRAIIRRSLEQVEMHDLHDRLIGDLSPGQQQRVFIARALAGEPKVIFLDEPTVGVDTATQEKFYTLLNHLNSRLGITLVLVSHDIDVVAEETTEVACINQTIIYHGTAKAFMRTDALAHLYGRGVTPITHHHV